MDDIRGAAAVVLGVGQQGDGEGLGKGGDGTLSTSAVVWAWAENPPDRSKTAAIASELIILKFIGMTLR